MRCFHYTFSRGNRAVCNGTASIESVMSPTDWKMSSPMRFACLSLADVWSVMLKCILHCDPSEHHWWIGCILVLQLSKASFQFTSQIVFLSVTAFSNVSLEISLQPVLANKVHWHDWDLGYRGKALETCCLSPTNSSRHPYRSSFLLLKCTKSFEKWTFSSDSSESSNKYQTP